MKAADGSDSLDTSSNKIPLLLGDQTLWWVMNDLNTEQHKHFFSTDPMGIEVQITVFGFKESSPWNDMMFIKWKMINKSGNDYDECYITLWDDPDIGIEWPIAEPVLSSKDAQLARLADVGTDFVYDAGARAGI